MQDKRLRRAKVIGRWSLVLYGRPCSCGGDGRLMEGFQSGMDYELEGISSQIIIWILPRRPERFSQTQGVHLVFAQGLIKL